MGVKHVEAFGDSLLVVQQIIGTCQCLDGSLNAYLDQCLKIIVLFDDFTIQHVSGDKNTVVNNLAQQASGFLEKSYVPVCQTVQTGFQSMRNAKICSAKPSSAKPDNPVSKTRGSRISRTSDKSK
jgi:rRNA maturation endonuclease Nob1